MQDLEKFIIEPRKAALAAVAGSVSVACFCSCCPFDREKCAQVGLISCSEDFGKACSLRQFGWTSSSSVQHRYVLIVSTVCVCANE